MDAIRGVLVVFGKGPRVAGMVDVVLEVGGEGPEGGRNVADEVEFVHLVILFQLVDKELAVVYSVFICMGLVWLYDESVFAAKRSRVRTDRRCRSIGSKRGKSEVNFECGSILSTSSSSFFCCSRSCKHRQLRANSGSLWLVARLW